MEIYRLKDEVPEGRGDVERDFGRADRGGELRGVSDVGARNGELRITDLREGVKNPERVNVYVNGRYTLSLDVAQVVDYKLKVGMVINAERLEELKRASEFGKEYQRTLEWVLVRLRSEREVRDYLKKRKMVKSAKNRQETWNREREIAEVIARGDDVTDSREKTEWVTRTEDAKYDFDDLILERLMERGYVDDRRFAEWWVENRFAKKGVSQKRLRMELVKKGVAREIIDEVLRKRNDEEEIEKIIAKRGSKYNEPEKLIAYLCRQGFSYDLVKEKVAELKDGCDE